MKRWKVIINERFSSQSPSYPRYYLQCLQNLSSWNFTQVNAPWKTSQVTMHAVSLPLFLWMASVHRGKVLYSYDTLTWGNFKGFGCLNCHPSKPFKRPEGSHSKSSALHTSKENTLTLVFRGKEMWTWVLGQIAQVSSACFCLRPLGGTVGSSLLPAPGTG